MAKKKKTSTTKKVAPKKKATKKTAKKAAPKKKAARKKKTAGIEFKGDKVIMDRELYEKMVHKSETTDVLHEKNEDVKSRLKTWEDYKDRASVAKKNYESALLDLHELVDEIDNPQLKLPGMSKLEMAAAAAEADKPAAAENTAAAGDEKWMDCNLVEVGLKPGQVNKLNDIGVETFRQLEHLRSGKDPDRPRGLGDVTGIGPKAVTEIEDACLKFIASNSTATAPGEGVSVGQMVKLSRNVRGGANKKDGMYEGAEVEVTKVDGDKVQVKNKNGKKFTLDPDGYKTAV